MWVVLSSSDYRRALPEPRLCQGAKRCCCRAFWFGRSYFGSGGHVTSPMVKDVAVPLPTLVRRPQQELRFGHGLVESWMNCWMLLELRTAACLAKIKAPASLDSLTLC